MGLSDGQVKYANIMNAHKMDVFDDTNDQDA